MKFENYTAFKNSDEFLKLNERFSEEEISALAKYEGEQLNVTLAYIFNVYGIYAITNLEEAIEEAIEAWTGYKFESTLVVGTWIVEGLEEVEPTPEWAKHALYRSDVLNDFGRFCREYGYYWDESSGFLFRDE